MGKFEVSNIVNLADIKLDDPIIESDYAIISADKFIQFKYKQEETKREPYKVKPGIWAIEKMMGQMHLIETSFNHDSILKDLIKTKDIVEKVDCFFSNLDVYYENGIEVPVRNALLFGPAGTGKTTGIIEAIDKYTKDQETAIIVWHTDKWEAYEIKDLIKSFEYVGVKKLIVLMEDLGGIELDKTRIRSDSSLLSLLDNKERTFSIPTMIIATTNHIEVFMGNLVNRPGRFDDKIKVGFPSGEERAKLLDFFSKNTATEDDKKEFVLSKYDEFSPAHIRESILRSRLHKKSLLQAMKEIKEEIELYKKDFEERINKMGFN